MSARLRALAQQTLAVIDAGEYVAPSGRTVRIDDAIRKAVAGTRIYGPDPLWPTGVPAAVPGRTTRFEVTGESSLAAARRLLRADRPAGVLNFASARHPGGGFLNGARAQEESLCRASALYACLLRARAYYEYHRRHRDALYSDRVIFSPLVPVFRDDRGILLEEPYEVSFLTAAAPNAGVIAREMPEALAQIPMALQARSAQVLAVAAHEGVQQLVLGAWGCGVFQNSPPDVARAFYTHLGRGGAFADRFASVVFAILDPRPDSPTRAAFDDVFSR
jgi:uncharacterized protein (TIGR02452 family)